MTPEAKGAWMRRLIIISLIGAAAAAGYVFKPKDKAPGVVSTAVKVTFKNYKEVYGKPSVLTVSNLREEGNAASDKLQEILERLKKDKYGPKVQLAEVDVVEEKGLAGMAGIADPAKLTGYLEFFSESKKMGTLVGQTDAKVVEETIDNILNSMLQRMGKDWKPEVQGTKSGNAAGVPGMSRDNGGKQLPPSFKPAPAQAPAPGQTPVPAPAPAPAAKKEKEKVAHR